LIQLLSAWEGIGWFVNSVLAPRCNLSETRTSAGAFGGVFVRSALLGAQQVSEFDAGPSQVPVFVAWPRAVGAGPFESGHSRSAASETESMQGNASKNSNLLMYVKHRGNMSLYKCLNRMLTPTYSVS
jgi:hypothetical protein